MGINALENNTKVNTPDGHTGRLLVTRRERKLIDASAGYMKVQVRGTDGLVRLFDYNYLTEVVEEEPLVWPPTVVRAKVIVPEHYIKPRCEAVLTDHSISYKSKHWAAAHDGVKPDECRNASTIYIEGKNLCRRHAGMVALDILLNEGESK